MNLDDIVPPLELCKLIPAGEFEESALYWAELWGIQSVFLRECGDCNTFGVIQTEHIICPAPTLQEIMEVLPHDNAYNDLLIGYSEKVEKFTGWHIYYTGDRKRHCYDKSAVTAALKLWLRLKGIEV